MGRAFHMGRLGSFATRVASNRRGCSARSRAGRSLERESGLRASALRGSSGSGTDARHHVWRMASDRVRLSPGCCAFRGLDKARAPGQMTGFRPRPGGRARPAAMADFAMATCRSRTGSDARRQTRQANAVLPAPAPASASGSGRSKADEPAGCAARRRVGCGNQTPNGVENRTAAAHPRRAESPAVATDCSPRGV